MARGFGKWGTVVAEARVRRADGTYRGEVLSKQPVASVAT